MQTAPLTGGFENPPIDAARAFRSAMQALARPGQIERIEGATPPAPLSPAAGALALTLCDGDTPVWLASSHDTAAVRNWVTFQTGAPFVPRAGAMFAIGTWEALLPLDGYALGTPEFPDRSATLIAELGQLEPAGARLEGPGIRDTARLSLPDTDVLQKNAALFPLGLDFFFTCGDRIAGLPRTTRVLG